MLKPKNGNKNPERDHCQTPEYALMPLLPYIKNKWTVWESANGEGYLSMALLKNTNCHLIMSDIINGENYFVYTPNQYDIQITNPPFSLKYKWLEHAYELNKPFALLMPIDVLGSGKAQGLFEKHGVEIILMDKRVDYKMPNKGWDGSAQFNSAWFTWQLDIGKQLTYTKLDKKRVANYA